jgi:hypothetical protein
MKTPIVTQARIAPSTVDPTPCASRALRERVSADLRQQSTVVHAQSPNLSANLRRKLDARADEATCVFANRGVRDGRDFVRTVLEGPNSSLANSLHDAAIDAVARVLNGDIYETTRPQTRMNAYFTKRSLLAASGQIHGSIAKRCLNPRAPRRICPAHGKEFAS